MSGRKAKKRSPGSWGSTSPGEAPPEPLDGGTVFAFSSLLVTSNSPARDPELLTAELSPPWPEPSAAAPVGSVYCCTKGSVGDYRKRHPLLPLRPLRPRAQCLRVGL